MPDRGVPALSNGGALLTLLVWLACWSLPDAASMPVALIGLCLLGWFSASIQGWKRMVPALIFVGWFSFSSLSAWLLASQSAESLASKLALRVALAASLGVALSLALGRQGVSEALRQLRLPSTLVLMISTSLHYGELLKRAYGRQIDAMNSRGWSPGWQGRARALARSFQRASYSSADLHDAMLARGLSRESLALWERPAFRGSDWLVMALLIGVALCEVWA